MHISKERLAYIMHIYGIESLKDAQNALKFVSGLMSEESVATEEKEPYAMNYIARLKDVSFDISCWDVTELDS